MNAQALYALPVEILRTMLASYVKSAESCTDDTMSIIIADAIADIENAIKELE